jgi:hypothetical protein
MFKKFVSNLPFSPSLIDQLPEYRSKLKREYRLRSIGLSILLLAFTAQLFITIFPAHPTNNTSPNNFINSGINTVQDAYNACSHNLEYKSVLKFYLINCNSLLNLQQTKITPVSFNNHLYSVNKIPYAQNNEKLDIISGVKYWTRPLWASYAINSINLGAYRGTSANGSTFFILSSSGNPVFINQPKIDTPCNPALSANCPDLYLTVRDGHVSNANGITAKPGDIIIFTLSASNYSQKTIRNYSLNSDFSSVLSYANPLNLYGGTLKNGHINWSKSNININQTITSSVSFAMKSPLPKTSLSSSDGNYFNNRITVVYGNAVSIKLPYSNNKFFELNINNSVYSVSRYIGLILSLLLVLFVSFLLIRTELTINELNCIREDYLSGGDKDD